MSHNLPSCFGDLIENFDLHNLGHVAAVEVIERGRKRKEEGEGISLFRSPPPSALPFCAFHAGKGHSTVYPSRVTV